MARMSWIVLAATLGSMQATLSSTQATAGNFDNGNTLLSSCTNARASEQHYCLGYIAGIADALDASGPALGWKACFPKDLTTGNARDVIVQWLQRNPLERHYAAAGLVMRGLAEAFPCK